MYSEAFCIFIVKTFFNEEKTFEETELVIYFNRKKEKFKVVLAFFYLVSLRPIFYIPVPAESSLLEKKTCPSSRLNIIYLLYRMRKVCKI